MVRGLIEPRGLDLTYIGPNGSQGVLLQRNTSGCGNDGVPKS
jgi:hypothetical protein